MTLPDKNKSKDKTNTSEPKVSKIPPPAPPKEETKSERSGTLRKQGGKNGKSS